MTDGISPELQFLIHCIDPDNREGLPACDLDWGRLSTLARRHRLVPLVHRRIKSLHDGAVPKSIIAEFERMMLANTARNAFLESELGSILPILTGAGIETIPLKGPTLAKEYYADVALRQFDDLDILVAKADIIKAAEIMQEHGYRPFINMPGRIRALHVNAGWGFSLKSPGEDYHVELLSNIVPDLYSFQLPHETLRQSAKALSPETNLLLLCVHGAKHAWQRLSWISDVIRIITSGANINWMSAIDSAESSGSRRMLLLGLNLSISVSNADLPEVITDAIAEDHCIVKLTEQIFSRFNTDEDVAENSKQDIMLQLAVRERPRDKFRYLSSLLFAPSYGDWFAVPLPPVLSPLYFLIRPFRILWCRLFGAQKMAG